MKTLLFLAIVLFSGFSAGIILALVNLAVVEPYLDTAIGIENRNMFAAGEAKDTPQFWQEFNDYRIWQKEGSLLAGGILGLAIGSMVGLVFAYSRHMLAGKSDVKKALVLGGIMWFTIFFIPFLKYPANPPTVGDPHTIVLRTTLYIAFVAMSGLGALVFSRIYKKMQSKKFVAFLGYAVFISIVFVLMPPNPDAIKAPMDLVNGFRAISASTMTLFWVIDAVILGLLWQRFQPHVETRSISN